jgi:hypothetical protein
MTLTARFARGACTTGVLAAILSCATTASAEVVAVGGSGFQVVQKAHVAGTAAALYEALLAPNRWWESTHTYSGDARRLTLDARAGGCWCETLPDGGSAQHMIVTYVSPGKALRLRGALGPLQAMGVDGSLTMTVARVEGGADLTLTYAVGGYSREGFEDIAKGVDAVLGRQVARLRMLVETGSAESKTP